MLMNIFKIMLASSIILLSAEVDAQTKDSVSIQRNRSKIETSTNLKGIIFETSDKPVGSIGGVNFEGRVVKNLKNGTLTKGIKISTFTGGTYGVRRYNFIDYDEISGIIDALEIIKEKVDKSQNTTNYTSYEYSNLSESSFGAYFSDYARKWQYYIQVDKYYGDSLQNIKLSDYEKLKSLLQETKNYLDSISD